MDANDFSLLEQKRIKLEKRALNLSMYGAIIFVIVEFLMALYTKSQAVLMDSAYDAAELVMIIAAIRIIPLLYRPTSEKHPFGFSQVEAIFITIKGAMLTAVTVGLVLNNIQIMMAGGRMVSFTTVAYFQFFATGLSVVTIFFLRRMNKKLESPMVKTELDGWIIDTIASFGMAVAFLLPALIRTDWMTGFSPYLDQVVAIVLSIFILPIPIKTLISGLRDLFLLAPDAETIAFIKESGNPILEEYGYTATTYDIIKTGRKIWVSIYLMPNSDTIFMSKLIEARKRLDRVVRAEYPDIYVELVPEFDEFDFEIPK